jgi:putative DNA primase/helicase
MVNNLIASIPHTKVNDNPLLAAALGYSRRYGWRVFPIYGAVDGHCTCNWPSDKCSPGKHPITPHGFLNASANLDRVDAWWRMWPGANIGAPTGKQSGFVVLDVDPKNGGLASLAKLEAQHGVLDTLTAITGSGGTHYYFTPPDVLLKNSTGEIAAGIDTRAEGGYVLLPPSSHISGNNYRWDHRRAMAPLPDWLLQLWPKQSIAGGTQVAPVILGDIVDGHRNSTLTSWAGSMRRRGLSEGAILAALLYENETRCKPPLPEGIVRAIAQCMNRYDLGTPAPLSKSYKSGFQPKNKKGGHPKRYLPNVEVAL